MRVKVSKVEEWFEQRLLALFRVAFAQLVVAKLVTRDDHQELTALTLKSSKKVNVTTAGRVLKLHECWSIYVSSGTRGYEQMPSEGS
jgi:hypothetical protein